MDSWNELLGIVDVLLGENGCPWDKSRTFENLRESLTEECGEVIEAVDKKDGDGIKEELGDVLLNVLLYAKIAERDGLFCVEDVLKTVSEKLVRRHSHIFGGDVARDADEAREIWDNNKRKERMISLTNIT